MVSDEPVRKIITELRAAGFIPSRTVGSHIWWVCPHGMGVSVPDGHRVISAGVVRKIRKAIAACRQEHP